jgi:hypothetical protein
MILQKEGAMNLQKIILKVLKLFFLRFDLFIKLEELTKWLRKETVTLI